MPSAIAQKLNERRLNLVEQQRVLFDKTVEENRDLTGEETGQVQAINEEIGRIDERIKGVLAQEQRAAEADASFAALGGKPVTGPTGQRSDDKVAEIRSFLRGEAGRAYELRPDAPVDYRTLSKLTAAAGANTVPTSFYNRLVQHLIEVSGVLQTNPTVLNTDSGEIIEIPKTTAHSTGAAVAEAGNILTSDPAFGKVPLGAFKYARLIQVSSELLTDTGVDLDGYLAMQIGRALGNTFGADLVAGVGTTAPRGLYLDTAPGVTGPTGTATTFGNQATAGQGFDLFIQLFHSVISPYRQSQSCAWLMNDTTASLVRRIKNTSGDYIWQPAVTVGQPDTILGKPVAIDPNVQSPAANAESVFFGDFSSYFVRQVNGIRFERSDEFAFGNDLVTFRAILRGDGALVDTTGAIKTFQHSAT